jgi:hypothetical protein
VQAALGVCGVEGTFRRACEVTLYAMRGAKHSLATLLRSTLYDPTVELASGQHTSALRKVACILGPTSLTSFDDHPGMRRLSCVLCLRGKIPFLWMLRLC